MEKVSWDEYESVIAESKEAFFGKRSPINDAAKAARKILEDVARKFKVDPKELVRTLYETIK